MKHLLKMSDLTPGEVTHILDVADQLKAQQKAGGTPPLLAGKSVALMFSKNSTRTRNSFEVGVYQLGGLGHYMNAATELQQSGRGEPLKDTARVLGRYYDCVVWRTYRQCDLEEFAELAGVPVINGLTDYAHPCQVLADLMTIRERRGTLAGTWCSMRSGEGYCGSSVSESRHDWRKHMGTFRLFRHPDSFFSYGCICGALSWWYDSSQGICQHEAGQGRDCTSDHQKNSRSFCLCISPQSENRFSCHCLLSFMRGWRIPSDCGSKAWKGDACSG